jgi:hypothetical protein
MATQTFETPELDKDLKLTIEGDGAKDLFIDHATRNGKYVKDQLARRIWEKHDLPMFRGTIVDEVPFTLRLDQILFNYRTYRITVGYRFLAL